MTVARQGLLLALVACVTVVTDLVTKVAADAYLTPARPLSVLGQSIRLTLVHNSGTAFGLFPGQRALFLFFSLLAMLAILTLFLRLRHRSVGQVVAMGLLLGGAAGNVHDRARFGEVTDFIQVGLAGHYWPVFNVADIAITAGVLLLALTLFRRPAADRPAPEGPVGEGPGAEGPASASAAAEVGDGGAR
jgi:signal peptidase II